ncbi:hypothetical protein DF220_06725 [Salinibacterium hongtaonis]|uniref:Uncharacterized protein n=1 Tax=Homoserinimonas hongtaonis TaxID=2079791 RepID=A0A2U1T126_9MICO|nr:hypothetical protein C2138_11610 [Salinibacterium hongtaonis]PWB97556.1 hypothetical protein DF220_06725 [Salinibacterium hongtaonis]
MSSQSGATISFAGGADVGTAGEGLGVAESGGATSAGASVHPANVATAARHTMAIRILMGGSYGRSTSAV